ncbi:unnamed protein product [Linum trigynum]|uniref:Uncharacterized protein n=1 Tax=Linum trigynum TaxID=586398 RepID=A0AAV2EAA0_9ROSI
MKPVGEGDKLSPPASLESPVRVVFSTDAATSGGFHVVLGAQGSSLGACVESLSMGTDKGKAVVDTVAVDAESSQGVVGVASISHSQSRSMSKAKAPPPRRWRGRGKRR